MGPAILPDFLGAPGDPPSKREVLRAALALFIRDGLCATGLRDIARESGYSGPVLYKFFPSKNALALHLFERCYAVLVATVHTAIVPDRTFRENFRSLMRACGDLLARHPATFLYVNEHIRLLWPQVSPATKRVPLVRLFGDFLTQGVHEGALGHADEVPYLVTILLGTLGQYARLFYFGEFAGAPEIGLQELERILERLFRDTP